MICCLFTGGWLVIPDIHLYVLVLTLSWRRSLSYRNQSNVLQSKSMDWFLYDRDLYHKSVNFDFSIVLLLGRSLHLIMVKPSYATGLFLRVGKFFFEKLSLTFWQFLYNFPWLQVSKPYDSPWLSWENIYLSLTQVLKLKLEKTLLTWKWFINLGNTLIATKKKINSGEKINWLLLK